MPSYDYDGTEFAAILCTRASRTIKLIFSRDIINFSRARIKIISRPGRAGSGRKIIISRHGQAGPAEKNHIAAMPTWPGRKQIISRHCPAGPAPEFPRKLVGYCVSPLRGFREKIYRGHRRKNISRHLAWSQRKNISRHWQAGPAEKNYIAALAAGWMSDLSRYN